MTEPTDPPPPPPPRGGGSPWARPLKQFTPWRDPLASDPTEHALLAAIRATPADEGARMVYADWLEQRGRAVEADFVRHTGSLPVGDPRAQAGDADWRRITSRTALVLCEHTACPGRWDLLRAESMSEEIRPCTTCNKRVRYVATTEEASDAGWGRAPIAIDAAADADEQVAAYKLWHERSQLKSRPLPPIL